MEWSHFFMNPAVVWVLIPVAAIVIGGVHEMMKTYARHQERMAMIANGMHPDGEAGEADPASEQTVVYGDATAEHV